MDDVRVHRNSSEPAKLGALAFTLGTQIHLGPGQEKHLPHEAWHVVQQKRGLVQPTTQMKGAAVNDDGGLEREADQMGQRANEAKAVGWQHLKRLPGLANLSGKRATIQRSPDEGQKQLTKFTAETEKQIRTLMAEHPNLTRVNAERAVAGPAGSVAKATGKPAKPGLKIPDVEFRQPTTRGASLVLQREVKVLTGGSSSFNWAVKDAANKLQRFGGGEFLMQVPAGTGEGGARSLVQVFKNTAKEPGALQKFGRYRSIKITIVDPMGKVLLDEMLEFPMSKASGSTPAPTTPPASGAAGASSKAAGAAAASMESKTATAAVKRGASLGARATQAGLGFVRGAALFTAVELMIEAAIGWLTYKKDNYPFDRKAVKFAGFLNSKLEAQMAASISSEAHQARQMAIDHPEFPVYAIVSFDLDYRWTGASAGAAAVANKDMNYIDARMVSLELGYQPQSKEVVLSKAVDYRDRIDTKRVTISIELNPLNETSAQKKWRSFSTDAARAASRGLSARHVAGGSHFAPDVSRADLAEEERRKKWGGPSWLDERELEERKLWVRAYIEYTAFHGPDNLYADAVKYLAELERQEPRSSAPQFNAAKMLSSQSGPAIRMMPSN